MKARIDREEIIKELQLKPFGAQGFYNNKDTSCPYCYEGQKKKNQKWGIVFTQNNSMIFHCFRCHTKVNAYDFLKKIDRLDLIRSTYENSIKSNLTPLIDEQEEEEEKELSEVKLPFRLKPLQHDDYLDGRGFKQKHYEEFEPSFTNSPLESSLKNYIVFKMKKNDQVVGWLARSRHTKEWHDQNLKKAKEKGIKPLLRYENSKTDFTKILGAYNSIDTKVVIIVEGLFDYINVDNFLEKTELNSCLSCVFTFGNSISKEQMRMLKEKGVENVILMYDPDKPEQLKSAALLLSKSFETKIALLEDSKIDPGDATEEQLLKSLENLVDPINFRVLTKISS